MNNEKVINKIHELMNYKEESLISINQLMNYKEELYSLLLPSLYFKNNTDITNVLQNMIDNLKYTEIKIPKGTYYISSPIVIPEDSSKNVNIIMSHGTILKTKNSKLECFFDIGSKIINNKYEFTGIQNSCRIKGGILDCTNVSEGIRHKNMQMFRLENINLINVTVGIHFYDNSKQKSTDVKLNGINITGTSSCNKDTIGIINDSWDNEFNSIRINRVSTGMLFNKGCCTLHDIHITSMFTPDFTEDKFNVARGIVVTNDWIKMNEVYIDNYSNAIILNNATLYNVNGHIYYYYSNENVNYAAMTLTGDSYCYNTSCHFILPSKGNQKMFNLKIRDYNDLRNRVRNVNCKFEGGNINSADFCNDIEIKNNIDIYSIWSRKMEANKYYAIAIIERSYLSSYNFIINSASDFTCQISLFYIDSTPKITIPFKHYNTSHKFSLHLGDEFIYEGKTMCYLYIKTEDNGSYLNATIKPISISGGGIMVDKKLSTSYKTSISEIGHINLY